MEFSCHSWGFNDMPLPQALGTMARLGFRYVDIGTGPHLNPAHAVDNQTRQTLFKSMCDDLALYNLQVADMYFFLPRISINDEKKRTTDMVLFKALLPFARGLGAAGVTVTPGLLHPDKDREAWKRTVSALKEMQQSAHDSGLAFGVEPHLDSMTYTPKRIRQLLKDVKGLQLTLDWAHLVCQGIGHKQIADLLPHTRHIHIRQAAKDRLQTPYDEGAVDVAQVVTALKGAGYPGFVCVEYMQTPGWHGMAKVNSVLECRRMRDALREACRS